MLFQFAIGQNFLSQIQPCSFYYYQT